MYNFELYFPDNSRGYAHTALSLDEFHSNLRSNVSGLSDACTKLSMLFSSPQTPPSLNETGIICLMVENATLCLTSTCCQCKVEWGEYIIGFFVDPLSSL